MRTGFGFFTMPLFTRLLGAEQYGMYSIYVSWMGILVAFMGFGCGQGIATGMYRFKKDYPRFRTSIMVGGTVISAAMLCGILLFRKPILKLLVYPLWLLLILFFESFAQYILGFASGAWIYEKQAARNMIMSTVSLAAGTTCSVVLLVYWPSDMGEKYIGRVIGTALPNILLAIVIWFYIFKQQPAGYNKTYWKYSLGFGVPLIFNTLSQQILAQSDRVMMQKIGTSATEIGIYSFFYSFVAILTTILNALNTSWCPFLYDELDQKAYDRLNLKTVNYVHIFTVTMCGFILLSREVAKFFVDQEYWAGLPLIPILAISVYVTFIYQFAVNYELFKAKPQIVAVGTAGASVINIVLNMILIPRYGMYGAAIATLISYGALAVIHLWIVTHWEIERYPLKLYPLFSSLAPVIIVSAIYYVCADFWVVRWVLGIALGVYEAFLVWKRKTIF